MKKLLLVMIVVGMAFSATAQNIRYVKENGTGNGSSWENPSGDIQAMINELRPAGGQVLVAAGTYYPEYVAIDSITTHYGSEYATGNWFKTFLLTEGIKLYGGFPANANNQTAWSDRDFQLHETILNGELQPQSPGDTVQNVFQVVTIALKNDSALIDGFTITGGKSEGLYSELHFWNTWVNGLRFLAGGNAPAIAAQMWNGTLIIRNNTIRHNESEHWFQTCQGINFANPLGKTIIENNTIAENRAVTEGYDIQVIRSYAIYEDGWNGNGGYIVDEKDTSIVIIRDNIVTGNDAGLYLTTAFNDTLLTYMYDIKNNTIKENESGIRLANFSKGVLRVGINDNIISDNKRQGVGLFEIQGYSATPDVAISIENNTIENNGADLDSINGNSEHFSGINLMVINYLSDSSQVHIKNNRIVNNKGLTGGGIASNRCDRVIIENNEIRDNVSEGYGGGIYHSGGSVSTVVIVKNNSIENNRCYGSGGGIYISQSIGEITGNVITGNFAERNTGALLNGGGGIYVAVSPSIFMGNNLIAKNSTLAKGGGILLNPSITNAFHSLNNTIVENNAQEGGGGIFCGILTLANSQIYFRNTIITGNTGNGTANDIDATGLTSGAVHVEYSLVNVVVGDVATVHSTSLQGEDPLFVDAENDNYRLQENSPARNAGNTTFYQAGADPDFSYITTDIVGNPRIMDGMIDMGAYQCSGISSIDETMNASNISLFPNPVQSTITISTTETIRNIELYNLSGQLLGTYNQTVINVSHLPAGVYFVKITTENGSVTKKVVKG